MTISKPAAKRSGTVPKLLKKKRLDSVRAKRGARIRLIREESTLAAVNSKVERELKTTASQAGHDQAFRLFVRTALNGDTDKVTGWKKLPADA